jgi:hypothetical protein
MNFVLHISILFPIRCNFCKGSTPNEQSLPITCVQRFSPIQSIKLKSNIKDHTVITPLSYLANVAMLMNPWIIPCNFRKSSISNLMKLRRFLKYVVLIRPLIQPKKKMKKKKKKKKKKKRDHGLGHN